MDVQKKLNLLDVFCIASGAMISSGLFVLPGVAHAHAGPAVIFSYLFAGMLAASGMLSVAEIITAMPKAGGDYFFITRTMGPAMGTVAGLLSWFSLTMKSSFALVGMSTFILIVVDWSPRITGIVICLVFMSVNIIGTKESGRLQVILVMGLFTLMLLYIVFGLPRVNSHNFLPFAPFGWHPVFATAGLVFVSYGGLLNVAAVAEEIKNPGRVIPLGMIGALVVVVLFYTVIVFVTTGVLSSESLDNSLTPISTGASAFMGRAGMIAMTLTAVLAFVSTANAGIMSASRYLFSLSRDRLIPSPFEALQRRFQTPYVAVIATGLCMIGVLFLNLEMLVKAASTVVILTCILTNLCLIVLRESRLLNYQPKFRAPFYPVLPVGGIIGYSVILLEMGVQALLISAGLIAGGLFFYWFYGRIRAEREYALMHLVERISNRELTKGLLESELKEIIRSRDDLCFDRFDEIVEHALIIDSNLELNDVRLFSLVAEAIHERCNQDAQSIQQALMAREEEGSTILTEGVAASDIVIEGEGVFELVMVRCSRGVLLRGEGEPVHAFFLLLLSRDERDFYLKAVASIAQIVQGRSFDQRWLEAHTEQQIRDVVLLGERRRICEI
jgi:amino acid transporter/mannitol/fructose-specific phosphotransferase system IIA component (Ntr-type)